MVQAGEDVTFIDPWPAHVEHMRAHGLRVTHARDVPEITVPVRALHITDAQQIAKEAPVGCKLSSSRHSAPFWPMRHSSPVSRWYRGS
jgi:hypothetical protein